MNQFAFCIILDKTKTWLVTTVTKFLRAATDDPCINDGPLMLFSRSDRWFRNSIYYGFCEKKSKQLLRVVSMETR